MNTNEKIEELRRRHQDKTQTPLYLHESFEVCPRCYGPVYRSGFPDPEVRDCVYPPPSDDEIHTWMADAK